MLLSHKNTEFYGKIVRLNHDGAGVLTHVNGKTAFAFGALPEEEISYSILKQNKNYIIAKVNQILKPSPTRIKPACPHVDICSGCTQQHLPSNLQLQHKLQVTLEQLKHFGNIVPQNIMPTITGPIWHYRHKARLSVRYVKKKNKLLIGFREYKTHYVADIDSCVILPEKISHLLPILKDTLFTLHAAMHIPQIDIAIGTDPIEYVLVIRHTCDLLQEDQNKLTTLAQEHKLTIWLQGNDKYTLLNQQAPLSYNITHEAIKISFMPQQFTQINPFINNAMIAQAIDWLDINKNQIVLDLFSGVGNFSLPLARHSKHVISMEIAKDLVQQAQHNAQQNNLKNISFFVCDLNDDSFLKNITFPVDKVLLDPARTGAQNIVNNMHHINPSHIVYVSCNASTLARDLKILIHNHGYTFVNLGILDMFPHTSHWESMALLTR